ncbi:MAG: hypothetical protein J0626_12030, partial [Rhodospirillaceae bacterium]|nr:hypothetical protein [Rhodospirillaceae bacterium]
RAKNTENSRVGQSMRSGMGESPIGTHRELNWIGAAGLKCDFAPQQNGHREIFWEKQVNEAS